MTVTVEDLAVTHTAVAGTSSRLEKVRVLTSLLRTCSAEELPIVIAAMTGEPRQGRFGVGWATVTAVKTVDHVEGAREGQDDGDVDRSGATVLDMDVAFTTVARTSGAGSFSERQATLGNLLARCSPAAHAFVSAILTGGLRQGALDGVMLDAVAAAFDIKPKALRSALTLHGDLGALATELATRGEVALTDVRIQPGRALQPMLAATAADVETALGTFGTASVEWKLDGARIQVHLWTEHTADGPVRRVKLFTRNLNDITDRLPDVATRLSGIDVESMVADGEVLGLDADGAPAVFQETMSRVGSDQSQPRHKVVLQPFLFDLLYLNGRQLVDVALHERHALLRAIAPTLQIPGTITDNADEAHAVQREALDRGHEGVMVKDAASRYEAGRRGTAWRKVKPVHTFDLVVLGAEWGHGRRTGTLSNLHLGARNPLDSTFVMVGKTFKGLTDELLAWQTTQFLQREVRRSGITVFVRPELVVEIAIDGVQRSTRYAGGVALRFARVKGYRPDRSPSDADTIDSLRAMLR